MTDGTDDKDLVKALDNVAGAAASGAQPAPGAFPQPSAPPTAGAVASPFPPISVTPTPPAQSQPEAATPPYLAGDQGPLPAMSPNAYGAGSPAGDPLPAPTPVVEDTGPLASIKQDALTELRPLVDKLNVSPEEKFDTYLLLIRSTDDTNLIGPAHDAAKAITDETRRAEALLDIIKEIDYLSHPKNDAPS